MAKKTVYLPDDLWERLEALDGEAEGLNLSREFQHFLRAKVEQWTPPSRRPPGRVRAMDADDVDRIIDLWNQVDDEWSLTPMAERNVRRNLLATLTDARSFCLVATEDGIVVGFTIVGLISHPTMPGTLAEIEELKIDGDYRRRGIGQELVGEAIRWANQAGVRRMRAHVERDNSGAMRLFEAAGFANDQVALNRWPD